MTKSENTLIMIRLKCLFPSFPLIEETELAWYSVLQDFDAKLVYDAVTRLSKYNISVYPNICDMRRAIDEIIAETKRTSLKLVGKKTPLTQETIQKTRENNAWFDQVMTNYDCDLNQELKKF